MTVLQYFNCFCEPGPLFDHVIVPDYMSILESNHQCWNMVWKMVGVVDSFELDKQVGISLDNFDFIHHPIFSCY